MIRERDIETYLRLQVKKLGGRAVKLTSSNLRALPDRLCIFPHGVTVFVEVKAPGRKPSVNQMMMIQELKRLGHIAVWLDSKPAVDGLMMYLISKFELRNVPQ